MKRTLVAFATTAALCLAPMAASAQHVDVGPGGVGVRGDHHDDHHETVVREHHDDHSVVHEHHDDHHDGDSHSTVIERH